MGALGMEGGTGGSLSHLGTKSCLIWAALEDAGLNSQPTGSKVPDQPCSTGLAQND